MRIGRLVAAAFGDVRFAAATSSVSLGHDVVLFTGLPAAATEASAILVTNSENAVVSTRVIISGSTVTLHYGGTKTGLNYSGLLVYESAS